MRAKFPLIIILLIAFCSVPLLSAADKPLIGARHPAISPDGRQIAFSYMGDIWLVSADGGRAVPLTNHAAYEREPLWSPDGRTLAFTSNRNGNNDVFVLPVSGGVPFQLTFHTGDDLATDFTPDGKDVIFRSARSSSGSLYHVPVRAETSVPCSRPTGITLRTAGSAPTGKRFSSPGARRIRSGGGAAIAAPMRPRSGRRPSPAANRKRSSRAANAFWPDWRPDGTGDLFRQRPLRSPTTSGRRPPTGRASGR